MLTAMFYAVAEGILVREALLCIKVQHRLVCSKPRLLLLLICKQIVDNCKAGLNVDVRYSCSATLEPIELFLLCPVSVVSVQAGWLHWSGSLKVDLGTNEKIRCLICCFVSTVSALKCTA